MLDEQQRAWVMHCAQCGDVEAISTLAALLLTVTLDEQACDVEEKALLRVALSRCSADMASLGASVHRTVVAMTDDIALLVALQTCCDTHDAEMVICRTPLALLAFRGACAWVADPACGSRSDWRTFVAEEHAAKCAWDDETTPLLLVGKSAQMHARVRRMESKFFTVRTFAPSQVQALCARVAMACLLRRASHE